jgi:hypothetical protein
MIPKDLDQLNELCETTIQQHLELCIADGLAPDLPSEDIDDVAKYWSKVSDLSMMKELIAWAAVGMKSRKCEARPWGCLVHGAIGENCLPELGETCRFAD